MRVQFHKINKAVFQIKAGDILIKQTRIILTETKGDVQELKNFFI